MTWEEVHDDAMALLGSLRDRGPSARHAVLVDRLTRSVLRPLPRGAAGPVPAVDEVEDWVWRIAHAATTLRATDDDPRGLEATAALHQLVATSSHAQTDARMAELRSLSAPCLAEVRVGSCGPYLVTNVASLKTWRGEALSAPPQVALCRCGKSTMKPYCDGSHASGWDDAKDPKRAPDRRERYAGQRLEILDNRSLCAHSGFCTDRLATAFHADEEPFVTPNAARMDDLVSAVRSCPSGALSIALNGADARNVTDTERPPSIEVSKDGPYRVTGAVHLRDDRGQEVPRPEGASLEHYSLCRCGQSQNKPFCSGMHWHVQFADPIDDPEVEPTLFAWAGGFPALLRMTQIFYGKYVPEDGLLSPIFAKMSADHPERVAAWLGEVFGGPKAYTTEYGDYNRMISEHLNRRLTEAQRSRWVALMGKSADDAGLPTDPEFRAAFAAYLEWGSRIAVENSQGGAAPPPNMPVPKWWWVCNAVPRARQSALAPAAAAHVAEIPGPGEALGFERHVRGLFRTMDRQSMKFAFDLWSHADVAKHARAIAERLASGTMPCDGAWPPERVALFERWIDEGRAPLSCPGARCLRGWARSPWAAARRGARSTATTSSISRSASAPARRTSRCATPPSRFAAPRSPRSPSAACTRTAGSSPSTSARTSTRPATFRKRAPCLEAVPLADLFVPAAVLDITARAATNADAELTRADLETWKRAHGALPARCVVLMRSGWDARWPSQRRFGNADAEGKMHFPGFSKELVTHLAATPGVLGIGVDTFSIDPGRDSRFEGHRVWSGARKWALECLANLATLPARGAYVFVGAPKVEAASGAPARVVAWVPRT